MRGSGIEVAICQMGFPRSHLHPIAKHCSACLDQVKTGLSRVAQGDQITVILLLPHLLNLPLSKTAKVVNGNINLHFSGLNNNLGKLECCFLT